MSNNPVRIYDSEGLPITSTNGKLDIKTTVGVTASDLGKAEDAAHVSGDTGVMLLGVREDAAQSLAGTSGDYQPLISDVLGRTWVHPQGVIHGDMKTGLTGFKILQTFTRDTSVTAYSAGDAINNAVATPALMSQDLAAQGAVAATPGTFFVITNARVISSIKGSGLSCNICIFPATFTATADNSELSIDDTTAAIGGIIIPCQNNYTLAVNARCVSDPGWWEMQFASASTTVYFALQAVSAYTPTSGEVFTVVMEGFFI